MNWTPLHVHSTYSTLDSGSKPKQIAARLKELGYTGCALTDHATVAGVPSFIRELHSVGIKGIAGCEFNVCEQSATIKTPENRPYVHLCVLAKNQQGWLDLIQAANFASSPLTSYYKPRISLEELASFSSGNWVLFSGHLGSHLASCCFDDPKRAYRATTVEDARRVISAQWKEKLDVEIQKFKSLFPRDDFYLEIQLIDKDNLPAAEQVAKILRWASAKYKIPKVATSDSHYCRRIDAIDQRVLLCASLGKSMRDADKAIEAGDDFTLGGFFKSNSYHIPSLEEMVELHTEDELANSLLIAELCESPIIDAPPNLPSFDKLSREASDKLMRKVCREGWKRKIQTKVGADKLSEYTQRVKMELDVLTGAGLSGYFLITHDYIRYAVEQLKMPAPLGRGSSAGSLVSYLMGITGVDPIPPGLLFERFYNAGRNTPGKVSLPDIDTDFSMAAREKVISYLREKYGEKHVAQMATFGKLAGRSALQLVLRANSKGNHQEIIEITKPIPNESEISDQLQEMFEEDGESSIIRWALENRANRLRDHCFINKETGELEGPLSTEFAQAIRLEGTIRSVGKHASGVIITGLDLTRYVPLSYDKKTGHMLVGVDMRDAEKMGLVKFDILSTVVLDKLDEFKELALNGRKAIGTTVELDSETLAWDDVVEDS